jgi:hypothetical protein
MFRFVAGGFVYEVPIPQGFQFWQIGQARVVSPPTMACIHGHHGRVRFQVHPVRIEKENADG